MTNGKKYIMSTLKQAKYKPIKWVNFNGQWYLTYNFHIGKENPILSPAYRADFIMYDGDSAAHDKSQVFQELLQGKRYYQRNVIWPIYIPVNIKPPTLKEYIFTKAILKRHNII